MEFCPSCQMRLVLKQETSNDEKDFSLVCPKCGYKKQVLKEEPFTTKMGNYKNDEISEQKLITVINEEHMNIPLLKPMQVLAGKAIQFAGYELMDH